MERINFVFLHGGGQGGWAWEETTTALVAQSGGACNTLALDVPGCGTKCGQDTCAVTYEDIVNELISDIEASGMRNVVLVGHSQAGSVIPRMAERRPDLFKRLIYASCSSPIQGQTIPEMIGKGKHDEKPNEVGWFINPSEMSTMERNQIIFCHDMQVEQCSKLMKHMSSDHWPMSSYTQRDWRYDHLKAIPASYVIFLQDRLLPAVWQQFFAERFHANHIVHIDAGHQGMMTRPHAFAEVLLNEAASSR